MEIEGLNITFKEFEVYGDGVIYPIHKIRDLSILGQLGTGKGYFATLNRQSNVVFNRDTPNQRPTWATHIIWYPHEIN